jgi:hypothetical protein
MSAKRVYQKQLIITSRTPIRTLCAFAPSRSRGASITDSPGIAQSLAERRELLAASLAAAALDAKSIFGSSGFLVGKHRPVPGHEAQACRSERTHSFISERFQSGPEQSRPRLARRSEALTARTALGQFPEKEWLDGPSFFRLSALPTTNPEYPHILST